MHDAGPSNSPHDARLFEVTDAQLSAELKRWTGATPALHPVGELLDRHWEAGFAYARLCTVDARSAGMLTTAAFTRLFGETLRQTGPTAAWRPQLLVTVRRIAAEWDTDRRRELLHPELRSESDGAERAAARLLPPHNRRLLTGAFQRLPQAARCLLWHTEVEVESLAVPAGLLGLDDESARVELARANERLREECLQVHRELAPEQECRRYLRMLDVTYRRGGVDIDPDLLEHLNRCGHCRDTAEQLNFFNAGLGVALAEAVLGWGAGEYLEARTRQADAPAEEKPPVRAAEIAGESFFADDAAAAAMGGAGAPVPAGELAHGAGPAPAPAGEAFAPGGESPLGSIGGQAAPAGEPFVAPLGGMAAPMGEPFTAPDVASSPAEPGPRSARRTARRAAARTAPDAAPRPGDPTPGAPADETRAGSGRSALKAARRAARRRNLTAAVATVSALVVLPLVVWAAVGSGDDPAPVAEDRPAETPDSDAGSTTGNPSWAGAAEAAKGDLRGRLHNIGSGQCVGIVGGKAEKDAETELTKCSAAPDQQWSYETDGLMRSVAAPDLCLDSHLGYSVRLAPCKGASDSEQRNVRYDFTLQGTLVPRFNQDLALSPAATDGSGALVLKTRDDDGDAQHWVIDTSRTELQLEVVNWGAEIEPATPSTPAPEPTPTPKSSKTPTPDPTPSETPSAAQPASTSPSPTDLCSAYPSYCSWDGQYGSSGGGYGGGYGGPGGYGGSGYGGSGYGGGRR